MSPVRTLTMMHPYLTHAKMTNIWETHVLTSQSGVFLMQVKIMMLLRPLYHDFSLYLNVIGYFQCLIIIMPLFPFSHAIKQLFIQ